MPEFLEPELLQTFIAIANTGSFTEAAHRVHRTQSAVSMQIKRLEIAIGRPLFLREGRSVRLTDDGELLLGHAHRILQIHRDALATFVPCDLEGTVNFGTGEESAATFLPEILARFAETHPQIHVNVVVDSSTNLQTMLMRDEIDFALLNPSGMGGTSGIVLMSEPVVWVTSAHHCAHEQKPLPLALYQPGCEFRNWAIDALSQSGRAYRFAYTSVSLAGIYAAVGKGLAISAIQSSNVIEGLRILDEADGFPSLPTSQLGLHRSEHARSPVHDMLETHILEKFRPNRGAATRAA
jgi:DNA-binding transcriptional LysR family regulator